MNKIIALGLIILNILAFLTLYSIQSTIKVEGEPHGNGHYLNSKWKPQADSLWWKEFIKGN